MRTLLLGIMAIGVLAFGAAPAQANDVGKHGNYAGPDLLVAHADANWIRFHFDGDHLTNVRFTFEKHSNLHWKTITYHHAAGHAHHFSAWSDNGHWHAEGSLRSSTQWNIKVVSKYGRKLFFQPSWHA